MGNGCACCAYRDDLVKTVETVNRPKALRQTFDRCLDQRALKQLPIAASTFSRPESAQCASAGAALGGATLRSSGTSKVAMTNASIIARNASA